MKILIERFPHVIPYLQKVQHSQPFAATIRQDHGRTNIYIRCADGRFRMLYKEAEVEKLLHKIDSTVPPDPYDMVFILGIGLGEACLEAIQRFTKKPRIVIIEPYPSLFRLALSTKALENIFKYKRLSIYLGVQADANRIIEDCKHILPVGRTFLFINPYHVQLIGNAFKQLEKNLIHNIRSTRDMWHTAKHFGKHMLTNSLANLPSLIGGPPMRVLRNRFKGIPVICVAAGPSLNDALPLLKQIRGALIIACDSAVGSLLNAGIRPHIVATVDFHVSNINKLRPYMGSLHETVLAFGLESNPEIVSTFPGERKVGMTAYNRLVLEWLDQSLDLQCRMPIMTSVMHLAVLLAIAMGADPIILVGVDLAYLNGQSHAQGSVYSHIPENENLIPVKAVDGSIVYAPTQLVTDRLILEQIIAQHQVRIINVSTGGAMVHGAEVKDLRQVIHCEWKGKPSAQQILDTIFWDASPAINVVKSRLKPMIDWTGKLEKVCHRQNEGMARRLTISELEGDQDGFKRLYRRLKKKHLTFQQQYGPMTAIIQDAVLNEMQTIIKAEEVVATTVGDFRIQAMLDELEAIKAYYNTMADTIAQIHRGLKTICTAY
ncbi:motility associated factor glycosyltransferase family protein [Desulfosarcina variabilis]|uniref:motility associated factor glycosyltransferase family protein n=1 Tax=Desulfosarcina variabilis TaxID=2300 RepID=UPI003AFA3732